MAPTIITTVITPAASTNLIDLQSVKRELDITDPSTDDLLTRWISATSVTVQQYCNRIFAVQTLLDQIYPARWPVIPGERPIQSSGFPIVSSPVVIEDSVLLVENTDFLVSYTTGQLFRLDANLRPRRWPSMLVVTSQYSAGYAVIPADVIEAVILLIKGRWFSRKRDPFLRQENIHGVIEQSWWIPQGAGAYGNLPPDVEDMLEKYRTPVVVG